MKKWRYFILSLIFTFTLGAEEFQFVSFIDYFGGIEPSEGYENLSTRIYMRPYFSGFHDKTGLEWVFSSKIWVKPQGEPEVIDPWDILDETYLFLPVGNFDLTLGQKIVTYGFADIYGPLNALHSTNRAPFSLDEKYDSRRPDPLFQIKYYPTFNDTIEFTYIPFTRPDKERGDSVYLSDTKDSVEWYQDPYILDNPHSFFFNYNRYAEKFDLQFFYGYYTENTPDFEISEISSTLSSTIEAVYNKKQTMGFAYATRMMNSTFSQDIAFNLTGDLDGSDLGAQNSDITVNTQFLTNLPWDILSQTSLVYSYFINHSNHEDSIDADASDYLAEQIQIFHTQPGEHIAFLVIHLEKNYLRDKMKTQLNAALLYPDIYLAPRISYSVSDYWSIETGGDIILADPPDQDFRRNPSNDNYYVRILYRY